MYKRPSKTEYMFEVMHAVAKRATCGRGRSGCVIARDGHIISTGYVGAPSGLPSCDDAGHVMHEVINEDGELTTHCIRSVHAEQNAICQAAKYGIALEGSELYCTMTPCRTCAMLIIQSGIKHVHCLNHYRNKTIEDDTIAMLEYSGINIDYINEEEQEYE